MPEASAGCYEMEDAVGPEEMDGPAVSLEVLKDAVDRLLPAMVLRERSKFQGQCIAHVVILARRVRGLRDLSERTLPKKKRRGRSICSGRSRL